MKSSEELKLYKKAIESLADVVRIQCSDGNWNYDQYMHGMANGLIMALSFFQEGMVEFLEAPKEWLCDKPQQDDILCKEECITKILNSEII